MESANTTILLVVRDRGCDPLLLAEDRRVVVALMMGVAKT